MKAFHCIDFHDTLVVVVEDPSLAAAFRALAYAWAETEDGPKPTTFLVEALNHLFADCVDRQKGLKANPLA